MHTCVLGATTDVLLMGAISPIEVLGLELSQVKTYPEMYEILGSNYRRLRFTLRCMRF
jgi:hypothetical protein